MVQSTAYHQQLLGVQGMFVVDFLQCPRSDSNPFCQPCVGMSLPPQFIAYQMSDRYLHNSCVYWRLAYRSSVRAITSEHKRSVDFVLPTLQGPRNCPQKLISRRPRNTQTFTDLFATFAFSKFPRF